MFLQFTILAQLFQIAYASTTNPVVDPLATTDIFISQDLIHEENCIRFKTLVSDFRKCFEICPFILKYLGLSKNEIFQSSFLKIETLFSDFILKTETYRSNESPDSVLKNREELFIILKIFRTFLQNTFTLDYKSFPEKEDVLNEKVENPEALKFSKFYDEIQNEIRKFTKLNDEINKSDLNLPYLGDFREYLEQFRIVFEKNLIYDYLIKD